jgi:diguanylate cyclase (GGDEF)-like protein
VIAIDTLRNVVENVYFGLYFGGQYGAFPAALAETLGQPHLLLLAKLMNIAAGGLVLSILLGRWLPEAVAERRAADERAAHLGELAATDGLTGLFNRRHFVERAEAEIARSRRRPRPLALLMLDIDHFKAVNDHHGHDVGDAAIVALARTCQKRVRGADLVGRLGGEEFGLLLPETGLADARAFAEALREAVAAIRIPIDNGALALTVSIGISEIARAGTFEALMKQADLALYEAKRTGRDRICAYTAVPALMPEP